MTSHFLHFRIMEQSHTLLYLLDMTPQLVQLRCKNHNYGVITKVTYFVMDNCKNFNNLHHHMENFVGISAEWHFFATSHGKGPCDGVGQGCRV